MTHPVILDICRKHQIPVADFFSTKRNGALMACRVEAARHFRDKGHSWVMVANLLKRNRDTVRYWLDLKVRECRKVYMLKRWHTVYRPRRDRAAERLAA